MGLYLDTLTLLERHKALLNCLSFKHMLELGNSLVKLLGKFKIIISNNFFSSFRLLKSVCGKYGAIGAATFMTYSLTFEFLRHHDEANSRPLIMDHTLAVTMLGMAGAATKLTNPFHIPLAGFFSAALVAPISWFFYTRAIRFGAPNSNIFYEDGTTAEEIERFRHQDEIERLGLDMLSTPNYGLVEQQDKAGL